jgi:hypothetical protein
VLNVPALPIEPLPLGPWLNRRLLGRRAWRELQRFAAEGPMILGIGRPSALALGALRELAPAASFFDAMDNFPEFHAGLSRRAMRRHENAIAAEVDLVIASSTFLADKFARRGLRVEKVLNACEIIEDKTNDECRMMNDEWTPHGCPLPHEVSIHHSSFCIHHSPVLGYLGCIGRWFDWPLAVRLARELPGARIELVGPCIVGPPKNLPENVRMLPACRQSDAAGHLARFSAGLIPFQLNRLTAGVDPIKFYEYRAAGLPVLSTRFGEMALRGRDDGAHFLDAAGDLRAAVSSALSRRDDAATIEQFRRANDWRRRFQEATFFGALLSGPPLRRAA